MARRKRRLKLGWRGGRTLLSGAADHTQVSATTIRPKIYWSVASRCQAKTGTI
jgi:hypothetical protein